MASLTLKTLSIIPSRKQQPVKQITTIKFPLCLLNVRLLHLDLRPSGLSNPKSVMATAVFDPLPDEFLVMLIFTLTYELKQYLLNNKQDNNLHIHDGINVEQLFRSGHLPFAYSSYDDYVRQMAMPNTFMGQPEITAAINLYNINIRVHFDESTLPLPQLPHSDTLHLRFNHHSMHYDTFLTSTFPALATVTLTRMDPSPACGPPLSEEELILEAEQHGQDDDPNAELLRLQYEQDEASFQQYCRKLWHWIQNQLPNLAPSH